MSELSVLEIEPEVRETELTDIATAFAWPQLDSVEIPEHEMGTPVREAVEAIFAQSRSFSVLTPEEEFKLFTSYKRARSQKTKMALREEIVNRNLRLVISFAKRQTRRGLDFVDLIQEGNIGLLIAIDKFKPNRGLKFSTYATSWINQRIFRGVIDMGRTIRLPDHAHQSMTKLCQFEKWFAQEHNRVPTLGEVAAELGIEKELMQEQYRNRLVSEVSSYEDSLTSGRESQDSLRLIDIIPDTHAEYAEAQAFARIEYAKALHKRQRISRRLLHSFSRKELMIFFRMFGLARKTVYGIESLRELAAELAVSEASLKKLRRRMLSRLRNFKILSKDIRHLHECLALLIEVLET